MKVRRSIQAATAAVVLGTAGALVLPAAVGAQGATHTLKLIAVTKNSVVFTKTTGGEQGTNVNSAGKTVGFDMLYFSQTSATAGTLGLTVDASGGFLYGTATDNLSTGVVSNGKVTGGTDSFSGATGTFTAKNLNKSGTRTLLTIVYSG
jgi:hypothetical protein